MNDCYFCSTPLRKGRKGRYYTIEGHYGHLKCIKDFVKKNRNGIWIKR